MKKLSLFICLSVIVSASTYEDGKNIYFQHACSNCHGTHAEGSGIYPRLAHKSKVRIVKKLNDFKIGKASSQTAEMMFSFAKELTKKDINSLALFLSEFQKDTTDKYKINDDILGSMD